MTHIRVATAPLIPVIQARMMAGQRKGMKTLLEMCQHAPAIYLSKKDFKRIYGG